MPDKLPPNVRSIEQKFLEPFIQIGVGFHSELFALDSAGNVWKYYYSRPATPAERRRFGRDTIYSRWGKLTSYRMDPDKDGYKDEIKSQNDDA